MILSTTILTILTIIPDNNGQMSEDRPFYWLSYFVMQSIQWRKKQNICVTTQFTLFIQSFWVFESFVFVYLYKFVFLVLLRTTRHMRRTSQQVGSQRPLFFSFWHSETMNFQERFHFPNVRGFFTPSTDFLDKKRSVPTFIRMIQCPIKEVGRCGDKGGEDIMRLLPTTGYLSLPHSHKHNFISLNILLCQSHSCTHLYIYLCLYHQLSWLYDYISCCNTVYKHIFIYLY